MEDGSKGEGTLTVKCVFTKHTEGPPPMGYKIVECGDQFDRKWKKDKNWDM